MKCRGIYRKWTDNGYIEPYNALVSKKAKYRRQAKKGLRRRERRLAENPMDWVYDEYDHCGSYLGELIYGDGYDYWAYEDLITDWDDDFNNYERDYWIYLFDWNCGEPVDELECLDELYYYSYNGMPMDITDIWYNNWIYQEYMEESK
ncbi:hypothetical protein EG103P3_00092 [Enterococcus phage EG103P3]|nr:hypothetical protein EG103P3_00092 [Enterococcus phage EG103P3]